MRAIVMLILLVLPGLASAQDLTWKWGDHEVISYRIQVYTQVRSGELRLYAGRDIDARVVELTLGLETDCVNVGASRKVWMLECDVRRAQLGLTAVPGEEEKAASIAREYADLLSVAEIQLEYTKVGRLKSVDVEGIPKDTEREMSRHELLRMLVGRAFGSLEVELPKGGDHRDAPWKQGGLPMVMRMPVISGTAGAARITNQVMGQEGSEVLIQTTGEATVHSGAEIGAQTAGVAAARSIQMMIVGNARFD